MSGSEMRPPRRTPCNECPWLRDSTRGYIGPHLRPDEWIELAHSDGEIPCHLTIPGNDVEEMTTCCGAAIFRANVFKVPRWADDDLARPDRDTVFARNAEFVEHHTCKVEQ